MKVRTILLASLAALLVPLIFGGITLLGAAASMPGSQGLRVRGPHGVVGIYAQASYAWVVPAGDGVVVIDTGMDRAAAALRSEIAGRKVLAVLLTHAHVDHAQGLDALPDQPVVISPRELPRLKGTEASTAWLTSWLARSTPPPRLPEEVREVAEGELVFGEARFQVVPVPGHSPGSVAYLWRDVLFVGDAVLGGPELMVLPSAFTEDEALARESLRALLPLDFTWLADGHTGLHKGKRNELFAMLGEAVVPPSVRVEDLPPASPARPVRARVRFEGVYSQQPFPDARGLQPAELVLADGTRWVFAPRPVDAHRHHWNRKVQGEGEGWTVALGEALPGAWLDPLELVAVELRGPAEALPEPAPPETWARGQWVELTGPLTALTPLAPGSTWVEAQVGGVTVTVPAEGAPALGSEVTLMGQVGVGSRLGRGVWCAGPAACSSTGTPSP